MSISLFDCLFITLSVAVCLFARSTRTEIPQNRFELREPSAETEHSTTYIREAQGWYRGSDTPLLEGPSNCLLVLRMMGKRCSIEISPLSLDASVCFIHRLCGIATLNRFVSMSSRPFASLSVSLFVRLWLRSFAASVHLHIIAYVLCVDWGRTCCLHCRSLLPQKGKQNENRVVGIVIYVNLHIETSLAHVFGSGVSFGRLFITLCKFS